MSEKKTPEIRFRGFTVLWEQRKLGEFADIVTGKLDANAMKEDGEYDFYTSGIQKYKIDVPAFEGPAITIAGNGATVGYMHLADGKFNAYQRTYVLSAFRANREFLFYEIGNKLPKKIAQEARTGNIPYIVMDMLTDLQISIPSEQEQEKVGELMMNIDNLITVHQRKLEKLQAFKQAMLEKMFPNEGSLVPEIRFRGFQGNWERASFGDVFSLLTNNTLSRADLNYEKGSVLNVHYGDILVKFREIVDIAIEQLPYITDTATTEKNIRSRLYNGDVIIADTAEDETVGKAVEVIGILNIPVVSGLHTIPCRPNLKFALKYFGFYLNSPSYRNQLFPLMQGIKVSSISKSALLNTNVLFPTDQQEQEKIGAFLDRLNSEITLLSKKLLKLQTLKQSLLQKMFV